MLDFSDRTRTGISKLISRCAQLPQNLSGVYRLLNDYGFHIRSIHGRETRRIIKYDDDKLSLFLQVRLPGNTNWIKINPDQARRLDEEKQGNAYNSIRMSLLNGSRPPGAGIHVSGSNLVPLGAGGQPSVLPPTSTTNQESLAWRPPPRPTRSSSSSSSQRTSS